MFLSMVEEQIMRERGQYTEPVPRPVIILGASAFIPESYVADSGERLALYNAAERASEQDLALLEERTVDRYGSMPEEVRTIFSLKQLELTLMPLGVTAVKQSGQTLVMDCTGQDAALRFLRSHAEHVAGARTVRDSVVLPMDADEKPLSFLFRLLSGSETVH
jgi:transcription-repair coupling factor (superfamily II helicase)